MNIGGLRCANPPYGLPMWMHAKTIKVVDRADGKAKVYILARHDGFYEYRGEAEI